MVPPTPCKKIKNYQIIPCLVQECYTFGQFTNLDKKENLQNNSHIQIKKKIFEHGLSKKNL